jgi:hypothetical protein
VTHEIDATALQREFFARHSLPWPPPSTFLDPGERSARPASPWAPVAQSLDVARLTRFTGQVKQLREVEGQQRDLADRVSVPARDGVPEVVRITKPSAHVFEVRAALRGLDGACDAGFAPGHPA